MLLLLLGWLRGPADQRHAAASLACMMMRLNHVVDDGIQAIRIVGSHAGFDIVLQGNHAQFWFMYVHYQQVLLLQD